MPDLPRSLSLFVIAYPKSPSPILSRHSDDRRNLLSLNGKSKEAIIKGGFYSVPNSPRSVWEAGLPFVDCPSFLYGAIAYHKSS